MVPYLVSVCSHLGTSARTQCQLLVMSGREYQAFFTKCTAELKSRPAEPFTFKTVVYDSGHVWWELRRVLHVFYTGIKEVVQTHKELLKWRVVLSALFLRLATTYEVHILESRRAAEHNHNEVQNPMCRQEYMVSSFGTLVLLLWLATARRKVEEKQRAKAVLIGWLRALLNPGQVDIGRIIAAAVPGCLQECTENCKEGTCCHMQGVVNMLPPGAGGAAAQVSLHEAVHLLVHLVHIIVKRNAAAATLTSVLEQLAQKVDEGAPSAQAQTDPLKEELMMGNKRKLRIDEDFKAVVTDQVRFGRRVLTGAEVVATTNVDEKRVRVWTQAKMLAYQAACFRRIAVAGVFGIAEDASRISCPGEETVVYNLWSDQADIGCFPPIQAISGQHDRDNCICNASAPQL